MAVILPSFLGCNLLKDHIDHRVEETERSCPIRTPLCFLMEVTTADRLGLAKVLKKKLKDFRSGSYIWKDDQRSQLHTIQYDFQRLNPRKLLKQVYLNAYL